jgi:hypothetical protein
VKAIEGELKDLDLAGSVPSVLLKARNSPDKGSQLCKGKIKSILEDMCSIVEVGRLLYSPRIKPSLVLHT